MSRFGYVYSDARVQGRPYLHPFSDPDPPEPAGAGPGYMAQARAMMPEGMPESEIRILSWRLWLGTSVPALAVEYAKAGRKLYERVHGPLTRERLQAAIADTRSTTIGRYARETVEPAEPVGLPADVATRIRRESGPQTRRRVRPPATIVADKCGTCNRKPVSRDQHAGRVLLGCRECGTPIMGRRARL